MNQRLSAILERREALLARTAAQRATVAAIAHQWRRPLALIDCAVRLFRTVRRQPLLIVLVGTLLARTRYGRLARRVGHVAALWQLYRVWIRSRTATELLAR